MAKEFNLVYQRKDRKIWLVMEIGWSINRQGIRKAKNLDGPGKEFGL